MQGAMITATVRVCGKGNQSGKLKLVNQGLSRVVGLDGNGVHVGGGVQLHSRGALEVLLLNESCLG